MRNLSTALLVLTFLVLGCKGMLPGIGGGGGGAASGGSDPKGDIVDASRKFIALPAFSAKMEGMGQTEIKSQVDYVAPDRFHVIDVVDFDLDYIGSVFRT